MITKLLVYYLRFRYWRQRRKGFGLLHEVGTRIKFRTVGGHMFIEPVKPPLPPGRTRAYNTLTKQWEEFDV